MSDADGNLSADSSAAKDRLKGVTVSRYALHSLTTRSWEWERYSPVCCETLQDS